MTNRTLDNRVQIRFSTDGRAFRHIPIGDLILQTELRVATEKDVKAFRCPCRNCRGGRRKTVEVIRKHLVDVGRDPFLNKSMIGGDPLDGYPSNGLWVEDIAYDNDIVVTETVNEHGLMEANNPILEAVNEDANGGTNPVLDEYHEVHRQVLEAFDRSDALHDEVQDNVGVEENDDNGSDTLDGLEELYEQATTPLYTGSKCSVVSATIVIMNMCAVFRVSNRFMDELLRYLSTDLLPQDNKLPGTHYVARRSIRKLGLNYNNVHACPDGCVLFEEEHADLDSCPKCSKSRWIEGSSAIPVKVIRHFPLIPRLKRMWRSSEIAGMLTGYTKHVSSDDIMRSVVDSPAWKHIDNDPEFGDFGKEKRNMRFALSLDGVNPFKLSNTNWSTWPILLLCYNFEPWFVTKKFFISMCILISGKHSPTSKNMDVFLRPLMRELLELWTGVQALDYSQPEGSRAFSLRALVMWTITDFPAYGLISGLCCKGYKGCPPCGPETEARMAGTGDLLNDRRTKGSKLVYGGIRRYLPRHHPYRRNKRFNGTHEHRTTPNVVTGLDVIRYAAWRQSYLDLGGKENAAHDPVHFTGVKRLCSLYELPYWQVN